ncbi:MAG: hypothetical protein J6Q45_00740 [Alistipes sp.]|nr:hypothetical protein [Alistipes sp.]
MVYEGDVTLLKKPFSYDLTFDYNALNVEGLPVADYVAKLDESGRNKWKNEIVPYSEELGYALPFYFSKKNSIDKENPQFRFVLKLYSLDLGNMAGIFVPYTTFKTGGAVISGIMEVFDGKTGALLITFRFNNIRGDVSFTQADRWEYAYAELGTRMKRMVKRAK